ncbi:hypothetical protein [Gemmatimonas sp.]|uniref:hypothetical protein n=1 Tax=Gemmatimonas sp. TaxID=1962908 RepID=UPI00286A5EF6|nr:hypothetical protein [Gemmatimonas sp.]
MTKAIGSVDWYRLVPTYDSVRQSYARPVPMRQRSVPSWRRNEPAIESEEHTWHTIRERLAEHRDRGVGADARRLEAADAVHAATPTYRQ